MNRDHTVADAEQYIMLLLPFAIHIYFTLVAHVLYRCLSTAHRLFPGKVNTDIIFGRPHQTLGSWTQELRQVCMYYIQYNVMYNS